MSHNIKVEEVVRIKELGDQFEPMPKLGRKGVTQKTLNDILSLKEGDTDNLRKVLKELGLTHEDVGECLGITGGAVGAWVSPKEPSGIPGKRLQSLKIVLVNSWGMQTVTPMMPVMDESDVKKKPHTLKELFEAFDSCLTFGPEMMKAQNEGDYKTAFTVLLAGVIELMGVKELKQENMRQNNFDV